MVAREIALFLNSTNEGVIAVGRDGIVTLFNPAAERILGVSADDALRRPISEIIPVTQLLEVMKTRRPELDERLTWRGVTIVTSRYPIIDSGEVVGAAAVFRDISTVQRLAEEVTNLREVRILNDAIFRSTQDAISVVDENGIGVQVNPAFTRVTGLRPDDVIGRPCTSELFSGESIHLEVLRTGKPVTGHRLRVGPAQKEVVIDAAPIIVDGAVKGSVAVLKDVTELFRLHDELADAQRTIRKLEARYTFDDVVGEDPAFTEIRDRARTAAMTPATILLRGESGTGKELFAHAIHNASARRNGKFIRVNCAALTESLLESELFGYVEGAFTGARKGGRRGLFEEAHGGTIFLDEVGVMNLNTQAKLLRVLQEREVRRVGGTDPIPIDVRVVAATNLDLANAMRDGLFREDLYYRLHVVPITIPALRHRKSDIEPIAAALIRKINQEYGRAVEGVSSDAMEMLRGCRWPGNIREIENVLRRAVIAMSLSETVIEAVHIPELIREPADVAERSESLRPDGADTKQQTVIADTAGNGIIPLSDVVGRAEAAYIQNALAAHAGNRTRTARALNISVRSLQYKMKSYSLQ